jgi:hypothetical protein
MAKATSSIETVTKTVEVQEARVTLVLTKDEARLVKYLCGSVIDLGADDAQQEGKVLAMGVYKSLDGCVEGPVGAIWSHAFGLKVRIETPAAAMKREGYQF